MHDRGNEESLHWPAGDSLSLPGEQRELESLRTQVRWFNRLRLLVGLSVLWLTALATQGLDLPLPALPLYVLGLLILLVDAVYVQIYRRLRNWPLHAVRRHVYLQILVDLLILTALLHQAGGITNPLALFYLFHSFIAALVLSVRAAVLVAACSLLLLAGLGIAERLAWLRHHPLPLGLLELERITPLGFCLLLFAYTATLAFSIYFVATVLERLRSQEQKLGRLGQHFALSEKLASVGTLAAGVSHEINNPIGVITNKVQVLRYRLQDGSELPRLQADLDVIDKHARRIAQITEGLLHFSREQPFALRPLAVQDLLREAADLVRVPFRAAAVELQCEPEAAAGVWVHGSNNHLLQVLINILLNAKDASSPGSVVVMRSEQCDEEVALTIRDQGSGIAPELLAKIFDPFFTTKDVDKGTGLGLAISHGIVERHRGRIEVESEPGRGATFRIVLPAAADQQDA